MLLLRQPLEERQVRMKLIESVTQPNHDERQGAN